MVGQIGRDGTTEQYVSDGGVLLAHSHLIPGAGKPITRTTLLWRRKNQAEKRRIPAQTE